MQIVKEFLMCMVADTWIDGGIVGKIISVFIAALFAALVALCLYCVFWCVDSIGRPVTTGAGTITGGTFTPAHVVISGKTVIYNPDSWSVNVVMGDRSDSVAVTESFYSSVKEGEVVDIEYKSGRISNDLYITEIEMKK